MMKPVWKHRSVHVASLVAGLFMHSWTSAQNVNMSGALSGNGSYPTLQAAFAALNAASQSGASVVIDIVNNTTETGTAVLNAGAWNSVLVRPSGGVARSISGNMAAGSPLVDLNGADFVTFDGLNSGGNALTLSNTSTGTTAGTCTVRMENDAVSNTITRCTVEGSSQGNTTGTIYFGGAISTGNDNNTVSFCTIRPAGSNLHRIGVLSRGTVVAGQFNSGITVTGCNVQDFYAGTASSYGIKAESGSENWTISNNRLFQTANRNSASSTVAGHYPIYFNSTSPTVSITGNVIGYASANGTGTYSITGGGGGTWFGGIYVATFNGSALVENNTVTAIALAGLLTSDALQCPFTGIVVAGGAATCTGNTIGSQTTTDAITVTGSTLNSIDTRGIYNYGSWAWTVHNNTIGGITLSQLSSFPMVFSGIRGLNSTSSTLNIISDNTIGGTMAGSISNLSDNTSSAMSGIVLLNGNHIVYGNTVRNMTATTGSSSSSNPAVGGIVCQNTSGTRTITGNVVYGLRCTTTTNASNKLIGVHFQGGVGTNLVEGNRVWGFSAQSNFATLTGVEFAAGVVTVANNMVALGSGVGVGCAVNGLVESSAATHTVVHNSVYLGGSATTGTQNTYALRSTSSNNTREYYNNILFNARGSSGSTGKHYAISTSGTIVDPMGLASDYNILRATGAASHIGLYNSADRTSIADWRTATGQDDNSGTGDPNYLAPTSATPDLHIDPIANTSAAEATGSASMTRTNDVDNEVRSTLTPVDIGADARSPQPPCTGTPPAGSISGTSPICSGTGTTLAFDPATTASGLTHQWASATSAGGPFSTFLGTALTQGTGNLSSTTYYRVTTTCTTSGLTNTSPVFTLQVNSSQVGAACDDGDPNTTNDVVTAPCGCAGSYVTLNLRAILEGPLVVGTALMRDDLRGLAGFPLSQPYSALGVGTITGAGGPLAGGVLTVSGNNAVVDWVLVELRDVGAGTNVIVRTPALVQRDGDVVGMDGTSALRLPVAAGTYRVAVRHRNHLGAMTASGIALGTVAATVDLSVSGTATFGTDARKNVNGVYALWSGDGSFNGQLKYTGTGNDRDPVLVRVGSTTPNNSVSGYWAEDTNMDGLVKYTGSGNDRDPVLVNVGSTTPNATRIQQLP